jgi:hypothetical protein
LYHPLDGGGEVDPVARGDENRFDFCFRPNGCADYIIAIVKVGVAARFIGHVFVLTDQA